MLFHINFITALSRSSLKNTNYDDLLGFCLESCVSTDLSAGHRHLLTFPVGGRIPLHLLGLPSFNIFQQIFISSSKYILHIPMKRIPVCLRPFVMAVKGPLSTSPFSAVMARRCSGHAGVFYPDLWLNTVTWSLFRTIVSATNRNNFFFSHRDPFACFFLFY